MTAAEFVEPLEGVRRSGDGYEVKCCAAGHDDRRQSLSVTDGDKGVVLMCHAGCATEDVVAGRGITMKDLFNDSKPAPFASRPKKVVKAAPAPPLGDRLLAMQSALWKDDAAWRHVTKKLRISEKVVADLHVGLYRAGRRRWLAYPYRHNGAWTFANCRSLDGEKDFLRTPAGQPTSLFNGDALRDGGAALLVEGEKDAAAALTMGLDRWFGDLYVHHVGKAVMPLASVVAIPGVAHVALAAEALAKQELVYIALDNDGPGDEAAEELARKLGPDRCRRVRFAGVKDAGELLEQCSHDDLVGWTRLIGNGGAFESLHNIITVEPFPGAKATDPAPAPSTHTVSPGTDAQACPTDDDRHQVHTSGTPPADDGEKEKRSQAALLVALADEKGIQFFHDGEGEAYASTPSGETWPIRSRVFRAWIAGLLYHLDGSAARDSSVREALAVCEARAMHDGPEVPVFVRVARHEDALFLDLGDPTCQVVKITAEGWQVIGGSEAPIRFRRPPAMLSLPLPARGGRLDELRPFLNLTDDDDQWSLVAAFLVTSVALAPRGPFPVLAFHGEQGSMKTSCTECCANIIDPRKAGLRALSHDLETLAVAAHNGFLLAFDNVSHIDPALSDGLCRLATGSGFAKRTHYENREETIFDAARPVILNGIGHAAVRGDLVDRLVVVELPAVPEERRRRKKVIGPLYDAARPRILAGLLDAISMALRDEARAEASRTRWPRMADFAVAAVAAEPATGVAPGTFMRAYTDARDAGAETVAGADSLAQPLRSFVVARGCWEGSASELLSQLERPSNVAPKFWPETPTAMGNRLARLAPTMRSLGIGMAQVRTGQKRVWALEVATTSSTATDEPIRGEASCMVSPQPSPENVSVSAASDAGDASDTLPGPSSPTPLEAAVRESIRTAPAAVYELVPRLRRPAAAIEAALRALKARGEAEDRESEHDRVRRWRAVGQP